MLTDSPITVDEIHQARNRIQSICRWTPLIKSASLSTQLNTDVRLKLDYMQDTGAFKLRGSANVFKTLDSAELQRGVVTYSTGNHGKAVAYMAKHMDSSATICVSENVTPQKLKALNNLNCTLHVEGQSQDDAVDVMHRLQQAQGLSIIDPINNRHIIAGHGTLGLELLDDFPNVDTVLIPISGGALACGTALAIKSQQPNCKVIGVCMEQGAAMHASLRADEPVLVEEVESLADSLQGGILLDNKYTFDMAKRYLDEILLFSEEQIAQAMAWAFWHEKMIIEGASACTISALLFSNPELFTGNVVAVLTGNSVDGKTILTIADQFKPEIS